VFGEFSCTQKEKNGEEIKGLSESISVTLSIVDSIQITDLNGNQLLDFAPDHYHPGSILLRDGQLWVMAKPDPDVEEDFFKVYRLGLE
jgi:hypothetical protein